MGTLDKEQVITDFTNAYLAAHGKEPVIEANGGWYSIDGGKNMRLAALAEMTASLGKTDTPTDAPKTNTAPAKAKSSAKSKKRKQTGDFSVKAFWAEQLAQRDPGAKQPR